ncbi:MAG: MotA/TolQ/ExbB proton channel family protein [Planctomycetota bacterium]
MTPRCCTTAVLAVAVWVAGPSVASAQAAGDADPGSLFDTLISGGPLLLPILLASVVMVIVVLERAVALRRGAVLPKPFIHCVLSQIREGETREGAMLLCEADSSHIARVFEAGLWRWGKSAVEVEQAILDEGERTAASLRRNLRVINGVAQVCPLLGLLGTVWGMMAAFDAIAANDAMGRPELLAGGIGQALFSTAAGLAVAIPALTLYLYFVGRVDGLVMEIDRRGQELVQLISAEGIQDRKTSRRNKAA